ncbi:MAG: hypothetical protein KGJ09_08665 [Candidatus Omnitrophica bacterium]|nr:hypothetical protein [Candidatus Omnitrophota bacterium]
MKSWVKNEILLLAVPFVLWIFCFWNFFSGHLPLFEDAISYADHIRYYTACLSKGVLPLWDPTWFYGASNEFFLRRMGDVNPLFSLLVLFKWAGVPSGISYLIFIGFYYFLAAAAIYLIARLLFADRFLGFAAYILFLFSSWGSEVFYNYIIIVFVPIIWFFYFLLAFGRRPQKGPFLGMCLCLGLIVTTYIPFFFLIILGIFVFYFALFYGKDLLAFLRKSLSFFSKNKVLTFFCAVFLAVSCIPGLAFYKASKSGSFVLPGRHFGGADASSAVTVGSQGIASGDLVSHGYFDRLFDDQRHLDMGDIYVPYVLFLLLLVTLPARANKLVFFLIFNVLTLFLVTITSASRLNGFFYSHLVFLKFIRQIYYLFWLGMLPMAVFLSVAAFKSLRDALDASSRKAVWFGFIAVCHLAFLAFLLTRQGVLAGAWIAVFLSLLYFIIYLSCAKEVSYPAAFGVLLLAVFIQSAQVYACMDKKLFEGLKQTRTYDQAHVTHQISRIEPYYATGWFNTLVQEINPVDLNNYLKSKFILYDNVFPYVEGAPFFKAFETTTARGQNVAYVPKTESNLSQWQSDPQAPALADAHPLSAGELSLLGSDADTWVLKAHLSRRRFLVINDNYGAKWHAFINGRPAPLLRANISFKGLWLGAGDSKVVLRYSTPGAYVFRWGLIAAFAGIFLYMLVLLKQERGYAHGKTQ